MGHSQIKKFCAFDSSSQEMLRHAMEDLQLSARTIGDLAGADSIQPEHIGAPSNTASSGPELLMITDECSHPTCLCAGIFANDVNRQGLTRRLGSWTPQCPWSKYQQAAYGGMHQVLGGKPEQ